MTGTQQGKSSSRKTGSIVAAIILAGLLIAGAFYFFRDDKPSGAAKTARRVDFLHAAPVGFPSKDHPKIGSTTVVDLDQDGLLDILVCDMEADRIGWIRQNPAGRFDEQWIGPEIRAPARVAASDVDRDGDLDLLVASMGKLVPTNEKVGAVVILENKGKEVFVAHILLQGVARVTDVRGGDFDGDGDIDLAVGQFGYLEGETRWMENKGNWKFESHFLQKLAGPIHTIPADLDQDGDLDIVSLVSQEWEEVYVFENDGKGRFKPHVIFGSTNEDYGSSGMDLVDLDRDGDLDVLFTNGDAFDYTPPRPRPWHGVQWLENKGKFQFVFHRIGHFQGASAARAADVDGDGDMDVLVTSAWNLWDKPQSHSIVLFENDGAMNFVGRPVADSPTHLIALEAGDVDQDGLVDFVTGGMHVYAPYDRESRVLLWRNRRPPSRPASSASWPSR